MHTNVLKNIKLVEDGSIKNMENESYIIGNFKSMEEESAKLFEILDRVVDELDPTKR